MVDISRRGFLKLGVYAGSLVGVSAVALAGEGLVLEGKEPPKIEGYDYLWVRCRWMDTGEYDFENIQRKIEEKWVPVRKDKTVVTAEFVDDPLFGEVIGHKDVVLMVRPKNDG